MQRRRWDVFLSAFLSHYPDHFISLLSKLQSLKIAVYQSMDPLSVTASIIAFVGVSGQASRAIRKLAAVRGAPDLVLALNNEITDLHLVITTLQDALQRQQLIAMPSSGYYTSITHSLQQALDKVQELESLYSRLKPITPNASGILRLSSVKWLREQSKIRQMRDDLRTVELQLVGALGMLSLYGNFS